MKCFMTPCTPIGGVIAQYGALIEVEQKRKIIHSPTSNYSRYASYYSFDTEDRDRVSLAIAVIGSAARGPDIGDNSILRTPGQP
ncbi:hypothetical protein EVAR_11398_1 [Eumeta japonica]|uniref:Uncharacterized protein n=1 Tax=Eumeta variegata TaxID=151549 RepID=A0A4C1TNF3_EUMVA|nr:hypothetical protein EVAR_11398_1 [Eumeta japonica]